MRLIVLLDLCLLLASGAAWAAPNFKKDLADRTGCYYMIRLRDGKVIANEGLCSERITPCSSFKIAASVMAFDAGILKDENQIIKWDGVKRDRPELNQDQTPFTWMSRSVKWVTEWMMPQLGPARIRKYLDGFAYGNRDFSGGLKDSWVTSSLKISAVEQVAFLTRLWNRQLPASARAQELTKKIIFIEKGLYGKTGTGCVTGHDCMEKPAPMIGNFVGAFETPRETYIFAANATDSEAHREPAGPRLRETVRKWLGEFDSL